MKYSRAFAVACISGASLAYAVPVKTDVPYHTPAPSNNAAVLSTAISSTSDLGLRSISSDLEDPSGPNDGKNKLEVRSAMPSYQGMGKEVNGGTGKGIPDGDSSSTGALAPDSQSTGLPPKSNKGKRKENKRQKGEAPTMPSEPPIAIEELPIVPNSDAASDSPLPAAGNSQPDSQNLGPLPESQRGKKKKKQQKLKAPTMLSEPPVAIEELPIMPNSDTASDSPLPAAGTSQPDNQNPGPPPEPKKGKKKRGQQKVEAPTMPSEPPVAIEELPIVPNSDTASDSPLPASNQVSAPEPRTKSEKKRAKAQRQLNNKNKALKPADVTPSGVGSTCDSCEASSDRGPSQSQDRHWKDMRLHRYGYRDPTSGELDTGGFRFQKPKLLYKYWFG